MKQVIITITAEFPDDAPTDDIHFVAGTAMVQVLEPANEEGEDYEWEYPSYAQVEVTVDGEAI